MQLAENSGSEEGHCASQDFNPLRWILLQAMLIWAGVFTNPESTIETETFEHFRKSPLIHVLI
jgi:hypothetical protein